MNNHMATLARLWPVLTGAEQEIVLNVLRSNLGLPQQEVDIDAPRVPIMESSLMDLWNECDHKVQRAVADMLSIITDDESPNLDTKPIPKIA